MMTKLVRIFAVLALIVSSWGLTMQQPARALDLNAVALRSPAPVVAAAYRNAADDKLKSEFGSKLDLNNTHIRDFRDLRGFYPNLASAIIQNAPYEKVEDVLKIPGLSNTQVARLKENLDLFTVTETEPVYNEGDDRYNPGVY